MKKGFGMVRCTEPANVPADVCNEATTHAKHPLSSLYAASKQLTATSEGANLSSRRIWQIFSS